MLLTLRSVPFIASRSVVVLSHNKPVRAVAVPEISAAPELYKMDTQQFVTSAVTGTTTPHYNLL
jgi:hypothetical protein